MIFMWKLSPSFVRKAREENDGVENSFLCVFGNDFLCFRLLFSYSFLSLSRLTFSYILLFLQILSFSSSTKKKKYPTYSKPTQSCFQSRLRKNLYDLSYF